MGDPARVYERKQEQAQRQYARSKQGRAERARAGIERLFKGEDDMGRKLEIAPHVTTAMCQWGEWANRKQFWANLNVTPFCKLLGIGAGREMPEIRLDPQSLAIQRAVYRLQCDKTRMVLVGYYCAGCNWDDKPTEYGDAGIPRKMFYKLLRTGSVMAFNGARAHF